MTNITENQVREAIGDWIEPHLQTDLLNGKSISAISLGNKSAQVFVTLAFPARGYVNECAAALKLHLQAALDMDEVRVEVDWKVQTHRVQGTLKPLPEIRNIIAVASCKGGVGKSTTASNLALALVADGARVGILDADIYGPSQPRLMGLGGRRVSGDEDHIEPMIAHDVQVMSVGFLMEEDTPVIWRGPMVTRALAQLLNRTRWKDLDYLIVDLPPGTGDIQLTMAQQIPVTGALLVTTPQELALLDVRKGIRMFEKVEIPVLGLVENMSTHVCSRCGHEEDIFGSGGGARLAEEYGIDLLGQIPLDVTVRQQADAGRPVLLQDTAHASIQAYRCIARRTAAKIALHTPDYLNRFPKIVLES